MENDLIVFMANKFYDGHYTIFKFTTNYKVMFGTPNNVQEELDKIEGSKTLNEALLKAIRGHYDS